MTVPHPHDADLNHSDEPAQRDPGTADSVARFARLLSHDLNNFTTVIRSYSELLLHALPEGTQRNDVAEIYHAADAMATYVQRVTRFTRVSSMRPAVHDVLPLVESALSEFAEARDHAAVVLEHTLSARVDVDALWCVDAIREVLQNAREASPTGPPTVSPITVNIVQRTVHDRPGVQIEVRDHGAGFTHDTVHRAEQPFVSTKRSVRGAGFGLTFVQAFLHGAHGTLHHSRAKDVTCVVLWLPTVA